MADSKITALTALTAADPANDMIPIVDVSDTPPASGNTKRISINNLLACSPSATLASATITGDLTVDTNTLFVDSANNYVGIGTASPSTFLDVYNASSARIAISGPSTATSYLIFRNTTTGTNKGYIGYEFANDAIPFALNGSEAMRLNSTGLGVGVTPSAGRGAIQLSAGVGFPATQVASSDANTLDDYEEGTWTGTLKGGTTDPTIPVTATGQYTKIGNQVFARIVFANITTTGASGSISITGLPFANGSNRTIGSCLLDLIGTFTGSPVCWVGGGGTTINFQSSNSNGAASDVTHNAGVGRYFYATITYTV